MEDSNKKNEITLSILTQLDLFQTQKINFSELYAVLPLEVEPNDPDIIRGTNGKEIVPQSLIKNFEYQNQIFTCEITPGSVPLRGSKIDPDTKSVKNELVFPYLREARIENALIAVAAKENHRISVNYDSDGKPLFYLRVNAYRIQKEIVDAINRKKGTNMPIKNCPFNYTDINEAIRVLDTAKFNIKNPDIEEYSGNGHNFITPRNFLLQPRRHTGLQAM